MNASSIRTRRWTRAEYYRLDELGIFHPTERLELVGGQIVVKERQSPAHATAIRLAREAFEHAFGPGWDVRTRAPITLDEESEPEPDVAVVPGGPRDYLAAHPSCPPLVLEVAEATLAFDRDHKSSPMPGRRSQTTGSSTCPTRYCTSTGILPLMRTRLTDGSTPGL